MKVYAPNKGYSGISAGVTFINGVGETDNTHLLDWFREKGYKIEENNENEETPESGREADNKKAYDYLDGMDVDELKDFAEEKSIDIGNATSKTGILKKIYASLD